MACEFDALADLEELQVEKSPDTPNTRLQIRLELQIASEPRTEHFLSLIKLPQLRFLLPLIVLAHTE